MVTLSGKAIDDRYCAIAVVCAGWTVFTRPECRHADRVGCKVRFQGYNSAPAWRSMRDRSFGGRKCVWSEHSSTEPSGAQTFVSNRSGSLDFVAGMANCLCGSICQVRGLRCPIYIFSGNPVSSRESKALGDHTRGLGRIWHRACRPLGGTAAIHGFHGYQSGRVPVLDNDWPYAFRFLAV